MLIKPRSNLHDPLPDGRTNPSVSLGKLYVVASFDADDFQIVNDDGEPIFLPRFLFDVIDDWLPDDWTRIVDKEGEWDWRGPDRCAARGFFERWHDGNRREREIFAEEFLRLWAHHEKQLGNQQLVLKTE